VNASGETANSGAEKPGSRFGQRRWLLWAPVLLLSLVVGGWFGLKHSSLGQQAELGAGYIAHVICSCRYVGNRDMASCRTDFEAGTEIVTVSEDVGERTIVATVPLLARREARFDPEFGCALDAP
jgi:hypothetical protein